MGTAIQEQTWGEVASLTWGDLATHQWMDFRMSLVEAEGEVEAQGVKLVTGKPEDINAVIETQIQGVRVEYGLVNITNEIEMIVSVSVAKKDYLNVLKSYMPDYYQKSKVTDELLKAISKEFKKLEFISNEKLDDFAVDTTVNSIDRWEKDLGIIPDRTKTLTFRREKIKSKLRAAGTTTKEMIKNVASAFSNGEVDVIEDNANYKFKVKFVGVKGIPENMTDLTEILEEIKPAHLAFEYSYTYNTWGFVMDKTWGEVAGLTWGEIQTYS